jgi:hypothetical protein
MPRRYRVGHWLCLLFLVSELTQAGFRHVRTIARWPDDTDRNMIYLVLFEKP